MIWGRPGKRDAPPFFNRSYCNRRQPAARPGPAGKAEFLPLLPQFSEKPNRRFSAPSPAHTAPKNPVTNLAILVISDPIFPPNSIDFPQKPEVEFAYHFL